MFDFIAGLLSFFYEIWPSFGGAIILLTLLIMVVLAPLTVRQTKSMLAMQRLQPEVKRLRAKYSDDREALNQELMALYQANGVNPLGGCLPVLVQMPVLLVLYQIMRGLTRRTSGIGLRVGEGVSSARDGLMDYPKRGFNPAYIPEDGDLYAALTEPGVNEMNSVGLDLAQSATGALGEGVITSIPYFLLVIGIGVSTMYQQRLVRSRATGEMNPQQQMIMKYLPFMLPIFSLGFPAALVLYWLVSNLFRSGQQLFITKQIYGKNDPSDADVVRPDSQPQDDVDDETPVKKQPRSKGGQGASNLHGSRPPVSGPTPAKKKKPTTPSKRTTEPTRERNARPTSKRVTPKKTEKQAPVEPESGRKSRWQERLEKQRESAEEKVAERAKKKNKNKKKR